MANQNMPRMSLVAQYDDLCRCAKVLTSGPEEEFKVFVEGQLNLMRKWKDADFELKKLHKKVSNLESENGRLETKIKHLKGLLTDADSARRKVESEKNSLARQINIIRKILLEDGAVDHQTKEKLVFLSSTYKPDYNSPPRLQTIEESAGSLLSLSDIDQTDEDLENRSSNCKGRRSKGKRNSSEAGICLKKKKVDETEESPSRTNEIVNAYFTYAGQHRNSEPTSSSPDIPTVTYRNHKPDSTPSKFNTYDLKYDTRSVQGNTPVSRYNERPSCFTKKHQFVTKTVMNRVKCVACNQSISYLSKSLKCQDCRIVCHPECEKKCPALCFPIVNTPTKGTAGSIADYTSSSSPMIPPLIVHCIREIEARGLKEVGLYRVPGSEREVKNLKEKFITGRTIPSLNDVDVHALCGAVKQFLLSLKEPLITYKARQQFIDMADERDETASSYGLLGIISRDLPQANRDTLSFLILHLQKIAESPDCKMSVENLAKVFGPAVVGYSSSDLERTPMLEQTSYQYQVMKRLLSIPSESWQNMLSVESRGSMKGTPENLPGLKETRLGPIYSSLQKSKSVNIRRNSRLPPRNSKSRFGQMQFASPSLK